MKFFKSNGQVFAFDESQIAEGLADGMEEMTEQEAQNHVSPPATFASELAKLNLAYQIDVQALDKAYSMAMLVDGPTEETKKNLVRQQYIDRKNKYQSDVTDLKNMFEV